MNKKGFTLIELMVVILIVAILAAVAIPILRSRIDAAKWAEGKAMMGTIATATRAYYAEKGPTATAPTIHAATVTATTLFSDTDLTGTYFSPGAFTYSAGPTVDATTGVVSFTIQCTAATGGGGNSQQPAKQPAAMTLDNLGNFN